MPKRSHLILNILGFAGTHYIGHPAHFAARPHLSQARLFARRSVHRRYHREANEQAAFGGRPREASGGQARWLARVFGVRTHGVGEPTTARSKRSTGLAFYRTVEALEAPVRTARRISGCVWHSVSIDAWDPSAT